jgi:hypothetical protein
MDPVALLKALLIHAAYEGACAVCEPLISNPDGTQVQIDPLIQDTGLKQKGLLVYEEAKVQYAAILRAFADKTGIWPDPVVSAKPASGAAAAPAGAAAKIPIPGADLAATVAGVAQAVGQAAQAVSGQGGK